MMRMRVVWRERGGKTRMRMGTMVKMKRRGRTTTKEKSSECLRRETWTKMAREREKTKVVWMIRRKTWKGRRKGVVVVMMGSSATEQ